MFEIRNEAIFSGICSHQSNFKQGPRFSIRMVIGIFCSDTVFVQLNQFSQILSRQCCLTVAAPFVLDCIDMLSAGAAPGPGGIPAKMIKAAKHSFASMLSNILQNSLDSGD